MTPVSRILIGLAALMLAATYFFPLWVITLDAPQYPEGLGLHIWINGIDGQHPGDLQKVNNLNHYIGMKTIHPESIPEMKIMPWLMRFLMVLGLGAALLGKRRWLTIWLVAFILLAAAGLVDFYLWGYDYGHNLDMENAIIKIPGMTYQPPVIGSKKLLNFNATSLPGAGGWVAIAAVLVGMIIWWWEGRRKKRLIAAPVALVLALILSCAGLTGCAGSGPEPIAFGVDQCSYCMMNIVDERFGSEYVSATGKAFKFDSIECLAAYVSKNEPGDFAMDRVWVSTVNDPGTLRALSGVELVHDPDIQSPMGMSLAAFSTDAARSSGAPGPRSRRIAWSEAKQLVRDAWLAAP